MDRFQDGNDRLTPLAEPLPLAIHLPAPVASQYFLTRTDVTQVNLSQNGRH
eukprot:COSAG04_NODE_13656_length_597_cov_0.793173_1_plen_50_part_01